MSSSHLVLCSHTVRVRQPTPKPVLVQIAGDVTTATLLAQIVYWFTPDRKGQSRLRVLRDGYYWVAKTREVWMTETGLGAAQYKRAISVLKQKKLIEVRKMRFGGLAMSHIRLLTDNFKAAESAVSVRRKSSNRSGDLRPIGRAVSDQPYTEITTEITDRDHGHSSCEDARARADEIRDRDGEQGEDGSEEERKEEVREIREAPEPVHRQVQENRPESVIGAPHVAEHTELTAAANEKHYCSHEMALTPIADQAAPPPAGAHKSKESSLASFWHAHIATLYPGYQKPRTAKEAGQLKHLRQYLGDQTEPVIAYAVKNWIKFGTRAAGIAGTGMFPGEPNIGFLLMHHAVAVNLMTPPKVDPVIATPAPKPPPSQSIAPKEEPYRMTDEEFYRMLEGLKTP
jgi:hypothetical protein